SVIGRVPRVIPDSVEPAIRRYGKSGKPVPLVRIHRVIIHFDRRAEGHSAVGAARKHHIGRAPSAGHNAAQHVNVIGSRSPGMIDHEPDHSIESVWINSAETEKATHVDRSALVKSWRLTPILCVTRAHAPKAARAFATDKQVAIASHVERSTGRPVRNNN